LAMPTREWVVSSCARCDEMVFPSDIADPAHAKTCAVSCVWIQRHLWAEMHINMAKRALIAATADFEEQCAFFEVGGGNCACANIARMESLCSDAWMQQSRQ
jgi:hypothetical protein